MAIALATPALADEGWVIQRFASDITIQNDASLRIVEAMLFVGGAPLTAVRACEVVRGLTPEEFQQTIDTLNRHYRTQGRPYTIQLQEQGYILLLRPRYAGVRERLSGGPREARQQGERIRCDHGGPGPGDSG